jgi:two-component system, NtrC family, sensor kinase
MTRMDVAQEIYDARLAELDRLRQAELRAAISRVASVIGHLIGTPLNVIAGRAALIRSTPQAESVQENARRIEEQVERLAERIRKLLDYLTSPEPEAEPRSVAKVLNDAVSLYEPIAAHHGVSFTRAESEVPNAMVEGNSVMIVLTSLFSLALRMAPRGPTFELEVSVTESTVAFDLAVPGLIPPRARLDRLDPPEDDDQRFEAEHLQTLSVCHAIARRSGGHVEVLARGADRGVIRFTCPRA